MENRKVLLSVDNLHVNFRVRGRTLRAIRGISLDFYEDESVAIVGESGSGKSTIAKILMKFYPYESGSVRIGSNELRGLKTPSVRRRMAYVSQDIDLFTGTIRENLLFAKPDATDRELMQACRLSCAADYINRLDEGLNYKLDEAGSNLSLGERQRLALARAFLLKPDILILDEATSNIDTVSESTIWSNILSTFSDTTVICIAHRLSTARSCDRIFVMDKRRFVEKGTHAELMQNKGKYYTLWNNQSFVAEECNE